jgi:hypothetical protein
MQQLVYDEASVCILVEFNDLEIYRSDRWEFTHTDWESGIFSIWNWMSWLEADVYVLLPPVFPIEMIALVGIAVVVIVIIGIVYMKRRG